MGTFSTRIRVSHPERPLVSREIELVVDTGATLTKLPSDLLADLGITPTSKKQMVLADSSVITREAGYARVVINGAADLVPISFGAKGEPPLLGATTLEILGFAVDPIDQKLVPRPLRDK
jgi:aspartyl protease family protein